MKQTMSDLSILQRVYLGFAILVAVMAATSVLTFRSQSELNQALDQVTRQTMPLVIASSQTQISLLSANKWLTDVLTEQDLKQILPKWPSCSRPRRWSTRPSPPSPGRRRNTRAAGELGALNQLVKDYLQLTDTLPTEHQALLTRLYKVNQAKGQFQVSLPQFKKNLGT